jgi:hypothetical protein
VCFGNLAIFVLQHIGAVSIQHTGDAALRDAECALPLSISPPASTPMGDVVSCEM